MTQRFRVSGMTCDGCARAVTNAIKSRAPSAKIIVDLKAGEVQVDGPVDEAVVSAAVEDAGFTFGGRAAQ